MLTLTAQATTQLKQLIDKQGDPQAVLRVFVSPGGCSGFQYGMALDDAIQEGDEIFAQDNIRVVVDEFSLQHLDGSEIDYIDGLMGAGFTVLNPKSVSSCGCGHSFHTAEEQGAAQKCS